MTYLYDRLREIDRYFERERPHSVPLPRLIAAVLDIPSAERAISQSAVWPAEARRRLLSNLARCVRHDGSLNRSDIVELLRTEALEIAVLNRSRASTPTSHRELRSLVAHCASDSRVALENVHSVIAGLARASPIDGLRPKSLGQVIASWVGELGFAAVDSAFAAIGVSDLGGGARVRDEWWKSELISGLLRSVVDLDPEAAYDSFRATLDRAVRDDSSLSRASTIWRPDIAHSSHDDEMRHVMIDGLILSIDALTTESDDLGQGITEELWESGVEVYRRIALLTASKADSWGPGFLERRIEQVAQGGTEYAWEVEFKTLLESHVSRLQHEFVGLFEGWVLAGPDIGDRAESLTAEQLNEGFDAWKRDWLTVVESALSDDARELLGELRTRRGPSSTSRWDRGVRVGVVRQISPIDRDELAELDSQELAEAISTALTNEELGYREDFAEVSGEGLTKEIASLLGDRPEWLADAEVFTANDAAWTVFLNAVVQALREDLIDADWDAIATVLEVGLDLTLAPTEDVRRAMADISKWLVADDFFDQNWRRGEAALSRLARQLSEEPPRDEPWSDASTAALNTSTGVATQACCHALARIGVANGGAVPQGSKLKSALESLAGRSETNAALALWVVRLSEFDPDWAAERLHPATFPRSETLFRAAWSTYVRFSRLRPGSFQLLRAEYERSVNLEWETEQQVGSHIIESQSQHLIVFTAWGELGLEPDGLMDRWFLRLSEEQAASANHFAAGEATNPDLESSVRDRLVDFARWRLEHGSPGEFAQYGRWATAPVERSEVLELLARASQAQLSPIYGDEVLEFLADRLPAGTAEASDALAILGSLVADLESWRRGDWEPWIYSILSSTANMQQLRQRSLDMADGLARQGYTGLLELFAESAEA